MQTVAVTGDIYEEIMRVFWIGFLNLVLRGLKNSPVFMVFWLYVFTENNFEMYISYIVTL